MSGIQTNVGGLRAVETNFRPIREIATGRAASYISRTNLNTPGLGVLLPEAFRPAAEFSGRSRDLFDLEILQIAEAVCAIRDTGRAYDWVTLDITLSILKSQDTAGAADNVCEQFSCTPGDFCFIVPEAVLTIEGDETIAAGIDRLRKHGYHVMLPRFGENGCPFIKLSELPVDYVMLSPVVTGYIGKSERSDQAVNSIVRFINDLGVEPLADGVSTSAQAQALHGFGCRYCAGTLSGEYVSIEELVE